MSTVIFNDPKLQKQFETEGFVQIPLLSGEDVEKLKALFHEYVPNPPEAFFSSSYLNDFDLKKEISDRIVEVIGKRIPQAFCNYKVFGSAFLSKGNSEHGEMPLHQDWTIVDERKYVAVNIWTPLQYSDERNGGLQVLKGSHSFFPILRSPTIPYFWKGFEEEVKKNLIPLKVEAGEAIILNQALVHYSPASGSDSHRLAVTTGLKSAGASMEFNFLGDDGILRVIAMDDDFLLRFEDFHQSIYKMPEFGNTIRTEKYIQEFPPDKEVLALIRKAGRNGKKPGFLERIFRKKRIN